MQTAYIVDGVRSAIGSLGGSLATVRADDLGAHVIRALLKRHQNIPSDKIDDVIFGCANQAGEDNRNVARMSLLLAGLPSSVPGMTVNRLCASGMAATISASTGITSSMGDLFIAGGLESMTRAPFVLSKSETAFARNLEFFDTSLGWRFVNSRMKELYGTDSMGQTAENVAAALNISRVDQDNFALWSQKKAGTALANGRFNQEIVGIEIQKSKNEKIIFGVDEFPRPNTTIESLQKLKPAFRQDAQGSVTAGNSSGLNDGACALLIASESALKAYNLRPLCRIVTSAVAGIEPKIMGLGPVPATKLALARAKLTLADLDLIELNEAFAAQSLGCIRQLGLTDQDERVNPNGGAIALGHPLGMSGARLLLTAALELQAQKKRYALCSMCIGVGQGMATIIEKV